MPLGLENIEPEKNKAYFQQKLTGEVDASTVVGAMNSGEDDFQLIDVRDEQSFNKGHVKGAINIQIEDLSKSVKDLDKGKGVLTYCYDAPCLLSVKAARILSDQGFKVMDVSGGYEDFEKKDAPIQKGTEGLTH